MKPSLILSLSLGLALTLVALAAPDSVQAGTNVVPNPGFEMGGCTRGREFPGAIVCDWFSWGVMVRLSSSPHSGLASIWLGCGPTGCYPGSLTAGTEHVTCTLVGPGTHPASFWYRTNAELVGLSATYYQKPDCTGLHSGTYVGGLSVPDESWHETTGELLFPAYARSADFYVGASMECDDYCYPWANFDDVYVDSGTVAGSLFSHSDVATR